MSASKPTRRSILGWALAAVALAGAALALTPFAGSLRPLDDARDRHLETFGLRIPLSDIPPGTVRKVPFEPHPIVIVRPDGNMRSGLEALNDQVWQPDLERVRGQQVFVFYSFSSIALCSLVHVPPGELLPGMAWPGGFREGCRSSGFDYAGRALKLPGGYPAEIPNLTSPAYGIENGDLVIRKAP